MSNVRTYPGAVQVLIRVDDAALVIDRDLGEECGRNTLRGRKCGDRSLSHLSAHRELVLRSGGRGQSPPQPLGLEKTSLRAAGVTFEPAFENRQRRMLFCMKMQSVRFSLSRRDVPGELENLSRRKRFERLAFQIQIS